MLATVSLAVVVLVVAAAGWPSPHLSSEQEAFDSLSETEKQHFVRMQLAEALASRRSPRTSEDSLPDLLHDVPLDVRNKLEELSSTLPEDFPARLYDDVTTRYDLPHEAVKRLVQFKPYCSRKNLCFNPGDIGSLCCPFDKGYDMRGFE